MYCAGNPILYIDTYDRKIVVHYTITRNKRIVLRNWKDVETAVEKSNGNSFVKNVVESMNYTKNAQENIMDNGNSPYDILLSKGVTNIVEDKSGPDDENAGSSYNPKHKTIYFNPTFSS
jgi:hypothetical protein